MKAIKFLAAALVTFAMVSCQKSSEGPAVAEKVMVKVNMNTPTIGTTRVGTGSLGDGYQTTISTAHLFVIDLHGNVITNVAYLKDADAGATDNVMTFETTSAANSLLVVANYPTGFTPADYATKSAIEAAVVSMSAANMKVEAPAAAGDNGASILTMYNTALPTITQNADPNPWTVAVEIAPIMARIELDQVNGNSTVDGGGSNDPVVSTINTFELGGVFLNNVYPSMKIGGGGSGTKLDSEDIRTAGWDTDVLTGYVDAKLYTPTGTNINTWAYNIAPVNVADDIPHLILRLKNVTFTDGSDPMPNAFIVVKSYNSGADLLTEFQRGYSYKIASLGFNQTHLQTTASPQDIELKATITVKGWISTPITPNV